ncbi:MAG: hypothetical protein AAGF47_08690 [Planctomycetota bacterium]
MALFQKPRRSMLCFYVTVAVTAGVLPLLSGCAGSFEGHRPDTSLASGPLGSFLLEGHELHPSLWTEQPRSVPDLPTGMVLPKNPNLSNDDAFIEATARGASQGRLDGSGIRAALYARYASDRSSIGIYGLEAESTTDADEREIALRKIWAYNARLDRAIVRRRDSTLLVVWIWTDGPLPEYWAAAKDSVEKRLGTTR